jgi:inositol oxygenase
MEIKEFRNYKNSEKQSKVELFYFQQHQYQTYDKVTSLKNNYSKLDKKVMSLWETLEYLDSFIDDSDPDTQNSQLQHALQTAEAVRAKYPHDDWFQVIGLIHDLGKILCLSYGEPQHFTVGDTFPVGCKFSDKCVFSEYFKNNPDFNNPDYNTLYGIYKPHCGLNNVTMSWGHDEYLYTVIKKNLEDDQENVKNKCKLPPQALYIIRYHSFYPWHKEGEYKHLTNNQDEEMLPWIIKFRECDLYSKATKTYNIEEIKELKTYYSNIISKYFPNKFKW